MIALFKNDGPAGRIWLVAYALILHFGLFWLADNPESHGTLNPFQQQVFNLFQFDQFSPILLQIACFGVVLSLALYFNYLHTRYRILQKKSLFGAFGFVFVAAVLRGFLYRPDGLLIALLLLCILACQYRSYNSRAFSPIYYEGFFLGCAVLLLPEAIFLLPIILIFYFVTRLVSIRELMAIVLGLLTAPYIVFAVIYLGDIPFSFNPQIQFQLPQLVAELSHRNLQLILLTFCIFPGLLNFLLVNLKASVQVRSYLNNYFHFFWMGLLCFLAFHESNPIVILLLLLPASIYLSRYFNKLKGTLKAEIIHLILLIILIGGQYFLSG